MAWQSIKDININLIDLKKIIEYIIVGNSDIKNTYQLMVGIN